MIRPATCQDTPLATSISRSRMTGGISRMNVKINERQQERRDDLANDVAVDRSEHQAAGPLSGTSGAERKEPAFAFGFGAAGRV